MAVIMRALMAGPDGVFAAGQRAELGREREQALVDGGFAVFEAPERAVVKAPEAAVTPARETAAAPAPTRRRK